jgi:hypothetical protein
VFVSFLLIFTLAGALGVAIRWWVAIVVVAAAAIEARFGLFRPIPG